MSVTFRSRKPYLQLSYGNMFPDSFVKQSDRQKEIEVYLSMKEEMRKEFRDPREVPYSKTGREDFMFDEGADHNELTLTDEEDIAVMRSYSQRSDNMVVELDEDGNEPADPEGTPFIAKHSGYELTPAMYKHCTTAEGKTFRFIMGAERNKYITSDPAEIQLLRGYIKSNMNCGISDPTYRDPFSEE